MPADGALMFNIGCNKNAGRRLRKVNLIAKFGKVSREVDRGKVEMKSRKRKDLMDIDVETFDMQSDLQKKSKSGMVGVNMCDTNGHNEVAVVGDVQHREQQ